MSIIPGIEIAAPDRTETSSGSDGSPNRLPDSLLERRDVLADLVVEPLRNVLAARHVGAAGIGRDREPGRHGNAERRHLGEADALAAEQLAAARGLLVEVVDVAHGADPRTSRRIRERVTRHTIRCGLSAVRRARMPPCAGTSWRWAAAAFSPATRGRRSTTSSSPSRRGAAARRLPADGDGRLRARDRRVPRRVRRRDCEARVA